MMSVSDMFYNDKEQPVLVYDNGGERSGRPQRRGFLSRQDSRNFRSSASPPPSRTHQHSSSWFGHRRGSQSPPRSRHQEFEAHYDSHRRNKYGGRSPERSSRSFWGRDRSRRSSRSPPPMSYADIQNHTKYKEDYTGYPYESGYTAENGYAYGGGHYDHGYGHSSSRRGYYSSSDPYSSNVYHGELTSQIPRTYQSAYGGTPLYNKDHIDVVKLKVPLCCEACEERITNHMLALEGVESVTCDQLKQKVTVRGVASPSEILRQGRECFKQTRFW